MAQLRKPIEREPAEGLLGRVARPVAKPAPAPPPSVPQFDPAALAGLMAKYAPAAPAPAAMASPPPAVAPLAAAPAAAMPSIQDYLAQKQDAFKPVETGYTGNGLGMQKTYSTYDSAADIAEYKRMYGAQANPWEIAVAETPGKQGWSGSGLGGQTTYTPYTVQELQDAYLRGEGSIKASDAYSAALDPSYKTRLNLRDQLLAQGSQYQVNYKGKAQNATGNAAEMARLLAEGGITDLSQLKVVDGKLVNSATGKAFENKYTGREGRFGYSALGDGQTDYKFQADANGNPVFYPQWRSSSSIPSWVQPVLTVASIIPSPIQPFAAAANGTISLANGKPLQAALSFAGAANSAGLFDGVGAAPTGGSVPDAPGGLDSVSGYNANGFGGLPKPIIGSELAGGASMIPGIDTNAFTGGLNTVAAGSGLTSLGGPPDMTPVGKPGLLEAPALPEVAPPQSLLETPPMVEPIVEPTIPKPVSNDPFKDVSGYNPDGFGGTPKPIIASETPGLSQIPGMNPDAFAPGYGGLLPGNGVTSPGAPMDQNLYQQAVAKGKELLAAGKDNEFYQWMTDPANALYVKAAMAGGGALLSSVGSSSSGGSSYKDDGYRPTISRGGFQASIPATGTAPGGPGMAPGGFGSGISLPSTGQANDGLWRYAGNRSQGGFMPSLATATPRPQASLISPPYTAPQTGLISPPAVANYDPRPTGPLPTNVPPMQYGYDDPVRNQQNLTPAQQRLLQNATGLLGTSAPRGFF